MLKRIIRQIIEKLSPRLAFAIRIRRLGKYEPETDILPYIVKPGELAIDVGANKGYFTYFIMKYTQKLLVFEPSPSLASDLHRTFGKKIKIEKVALSNEFGKATLSIPVSSGQKVFMLGTIEPDNPLAGSENVITVDVEKKRLDDYQLEKVGFIKIDVEGHELAVLQGSRKTLARYLPSLLIEAEDRHKPDAVKEINEFLKEFGYKGFFLLNNEIKPIEEFNIEKHQNPSITPDRTSKERPLYINNFFFIAGDETIKKLPRTLS